MSEEKLKYNKVSIKNLDTGEHTVYTFQPITWMRDQQLSNESLLADHETINVNELWIKRLHEATGLDDTELRTMDRRTFQTLLTKWLILNEVDSTSFLEDLNPEKND
ncbi:MAG: hypothetical protein O6761_07800 [Thaumarchaeota archaeon]|nr:hypothetical protein [Nitrososphaerota archaeon]